MSVFLNAQAVWTDAFCCINRCDLFLFCHQCESRQQVRCACVVLIWLCVVCCNLAIGAQVTWNLSLRSVQGNKLFLSEKLDSIISYKAWRQRSDNTDLETLAWRTCMVRFQNNHCWCSLSSEQLFFLHPFPYPLLLGKEICLSFPSLPAACKSFLNKPN